MKDETHNHLRPIGTKLKLDLNIDNTGFTLIEVMIAIAIIGILASIAIPIYIKYKEEARVNVDLRKALELLERAGEAHKNDDIDQAIELYRESLAYCPTADAHTYLGWMYSIQDRLHEAIEECHQAIEIDPDTRNRIWQNHHP